MFSAPNVLQHLQNFWNELEKASHAMKNSCNAMKQTCLAFNLPDEAMALDTDALTSVSNAAMNTPQLAGLATEISTDPQAVKDPGFKELGEIIKGAYLLAKELNGLIILGDKEYAAQLKKIESPSVQQEGESEEATIKEKLALFRSNRIAWENRVYKMLQTMLKNSEGNWKNTAKNLLIGVCAEMVMLAASAACVISSLVGVGSSLAKMNPVGTMAYLSTLAGGLGAMAASLAAIPVTIVVGIGAVAYRANAESTAARNANK